MAKRRQPTQPQKLVEMADRLYELVRTSTGQVFAVPKRGARVAVPVQGRGGSLSKKLTLAYFDRYGSPPTPTAISGALTVLEARALDSDPVTVSQRCNLAGRRLVLDLGDSSGRVVVVEDGGWRIEKRPPSDVVFRRTALTEALPKPKPGGSLDELRELVNVTDEGWDLIRAWLVMAWQPHVPVPILSLQGMAGSGKSFAGKALVAVTDPASAPLRATPRDLGEWQTTAVASRVVGLDNLSRIPEWLSDALCRTVTGDGGAKRRLYSDDELIVTNYKRALLLTSIDLGSLRGDLGERLMPVELPPLRRRRRREAQLKDELRRRLPSILGGLLDLVAEVLDNPAPQPRRAPRMADAATVMASVDRALGSDSLGAYREGIRRLTEIVMESDPLAEVVLAFMADRASWQGTSTDLYRELDLLGGHERRNWPANARGLSERLRRMQRELADARGLVVSWGRGHERRIVLRWRRGRQPGGSNGRRPKVKRRVG